jgi:hypothetical protein
MIQNNGQPIGSNGSKLIDSATGAVTGANFYTLVVQEDTAISLLAGGTDGDTGTGTNYLAAQNLTGKTLKAGAIICPPKGFSFKSITISSGSVIAY